jgi:hypothetical protein
MWVMNLLLNGEQLTVMTSDSQVQTLQVSGSFTPKVSPENAAIKLLAHLHPR